MKTLRILLIAVIIIAAIVYILHRQQSATPADTTPAPTEQASSITGCYVAHLAQDVYTINIQSVSGENVSGTLEYDNFQKDSSHGTLNGMYMNGLLLGDYAFTSEGMDSVRQVIFKKTPDGFIQGFGPVATVGNKEQFTDMNQISYDNSPEYIAVPCQG